MKKASKALAKWLHDTWIGYVIAVVTGLQVNALLPDDTPPDHTAAIAAIQDSLSNHAAELRELRDQLEARDSVVLAQLDALVGSPRDPEGHHRN